MPNDAKCGLLVGVGLVLAVAVLFFQKEPGGPETASTAPQALTPVVPASAGPQGGAAPPPAAVPPIPRPRTGREVPGVTASFVAGDAPTRIEPAGK